MKDHNKWKSILKKLEIVLECSIGLSVVSEAEILEFESRHNLILPAEYKDFCQVIGTGRFMSNDFYIEVPDPERSEEVLISNGIILEACNDSYKGWSSRNQKILDNSYLFGGSDNFVSFVFDKRTYNEVDKSYDIYGISCHNGFIYSFGRSFLKFIKNYCVGDKAWIECPMLLENTVVASERNNQLAKNTIFIPFPLRREDYELFE